MYKQNDLRVKTWDELLATPGAKLLDNGEIYHEDSYFVPAMKKYCGNEITPNNQDHGHTTIKDRDGLWCFADWMLTEANVEIKSVLVENKATREIIKVVHNPLAHVATLDKVSVGMWVFGNAEGWRQVTSVSDGNYMVKQDDFCSTLVNADAKRCKADKYPGWFTVDIFNGTSPPEPVIDWSKVPRGTHVEGSQDGVKWRDVCEFITYVAGAHMPYVIRDHDDLLLYIHCRLATDPKPEWLK